MKFPHFHFSFITANSYLYFMDSYLDSKERQVTYFLYIQLIGWNGICNRILCERKIASLHASGEAVADTVSGCYEYPEPTLNTNGMRAEPNIGGDPSIEIGSLRSNARLPNSYYEAAQIYEGTPYLWGSSSAAGTDCSGLVCLSKRAESRWTTSGGMPPGNWSAMTYTHSRAGFMQVARTGDLVVWPGSHTAYYAGGTRLFHAHGSAGTPTGYTNDLIWYLSNRGYPNLYRQNR